MRVRKRSSKNGLNTKMVYRVRRNIFSYIKVMEPSISGKDLNRLVCLQPLLVELK